MSLFKDPWILSFLILVPLFLLLALRRRVNSNFTFPSGSLLREFRPTMRIRLSKLPVYLRTIALICILLSMARPQTILDRTRTTSEGVDIVLALDTSTSMLAEDFKVGARRINRFEVVREVVKDFISKRKDDRIGIIAFAARAYTVSPLSTDHQWLLENLDRIRIGMIEDATAIGSAITSSLNRLKTSKTKSKIIILLTDGINNAGSISPLISAEAAKALKVKVYTIGVGSRGLVPYPLKDVYGRTVYQNIPIEMDEDSLKRIAEITNGKYYRATDVETLRKIYDEINRLEKSNIEHFGYRDYSELFPYFLIPAIVILLLEILLANTIFLKVP